MYLKYKPIYKETDGNIEEAKGIYVYTSTGKEMIITMNSKDELVINSENMIVLPQSQNQVNIK